MAFLYGLYVDKNFLKDNSVPPAMILNRINEECSQAARSLDAIYETKRMFTVASVNHQPFRAL